MPNDDLAETKAPFQIRDFRRDTQKLAKDCAKAAGLTMAEWMDRAVHTQARADRDDGLLPPSPASQVPDTLAARMQGVAGLMHGLAAVKTATGVASGKGVVLLALRCLGEQMTEVIEPRPRRGRAGGILPPNGRAGTVRYANADPRPGPAVLLEATSTPDETPPDVGDL